MGLSRLDHVELRGDQFYPLVVLANGNPLRITSDDSIEFQEALFFGVKAVDNSTGAYTPNTNSIFLGGTTGPGGTGDKRIGKEIFVGEPRRVIAPIGQKLRLSDYWVRGTSGDGVLVEYC